MESLSSPNCASMAQAQIRAALMQVIDPEIGLNIVDLGLVYDIESKPGGMAHRLDHDIARSSDGAIDFG